MFFGIQCSEMNAATMIDTWWAHQAVSFCEISSIWPLGWAYPYQR